MAEVDLSVTAGTELREAQSSVCALVVLQSACPRVTLEKMERLAYHPPRPQAIARCNDQRTAVKAIDIHPDGQGN
ncbi:hypothetical protein [Rhodoglobus aureus]|uniref:Uncharacterized protein n=1 Tax=Rhodoglobus aureus TaxID=191497 RepID=A0ABP4G3V9_9MICO